MTATWPKPTIRAEVDAWINTTRAALDRLTPEQLEVVQSKVTAALDDWWRNELARVRACRSISTGHSGTSAA